MEQCAQKDKRMYAILEPIMGTKNWGDLPYVLAKVQKDLTDEFYRWVDELAAGGEGAEPFQDFLQRRAALHGLVDE
jgi:hypothetical protein